MANQINSQEGNDKEIMILVGEVEVNKHLLLILPFAMSTRSVRTVRVSFQYLHCSLQQNNCQVVGQLYPTLGYHLEIEV